MEGSPFSPLRYRDVAWLNVLRLRLDALNYSWQKLVLEYDSSEQFSLLEGLLGEVNISRIAIALIGTWLVILLPVGFLLMRSGRGQRLDAASEMYLQFCRKLARVGLPRERSEAPGDYAQRVAMARPELAVECQSITGIYDALSYREVGDQQALSLLRRQVRSFNPGK